MKVIILLVLEHCLAGYGFSHTRMLKFVPLFALWYNYSVSLCNLFVLVRCTAQTMPYNRWFVLICDKYSMQWCWGEWSVYGRWMEFRWQESLRAKPLLSFVPLLPTQSLLLSSADRLLMTLKFCHFQIRLVSHAVSLAVPVRFTRSVAASFFQLLYCG